MENTVESWNILKNGIGEKIKNTLVGTSTFPLQFESTKEWITQSITEDPNIAYELLKVYSSPLSVTEPIDKGAKDLLQPFLNSWSEYPSLEVEYLLRTLSQHITNCQSMREKAQELEVRAISETSMALFQKEIIENALQLVESAAEHQQKFMGNLAELSIKDMNDSTFKITGASSIKEYWKTFEDSTKKQLFSQASFIDSKLDQMKQDGSGLNYLQRFSALKHQFNIELKEAYLRAIAACAGLNSVYNIDYPLPEITDIGYIDALSIWARGATYKLEKKLFKWKETTILLGLNSGDLNLPKIMSTAEFNAARTNGVFIFNITNNTLNRLGIEIKNARLKGIDLIAFSGDGNSLVHNYWRARVDLPEQIVKTQNGMEWSTRPYLFFSQVTYPSISKPVQSNYQREVYNSSPFGEWIIRIEPNDLVRGTQLADTVLSNLILKLTMSIES